MHMVMYILTYHAETKTFVPVYDSCDRGVEYTSEVDCMSAQILLRSWFPPKILIMHVVLDAANKRTRTVIMHWIPPKPTSYPCLLFLPGPIVY